jgi:hypothetical protein
MQNGLFIVWNSHKKYLGVFNACLLNKLFNFEIFILIYKIFLEKFHNSLLQKKKKNIFEKKIPKNPKKINIFVENNITSVKATKVVIRVYTQ